MKPPFERISTLKKSHLKNRPDTKKEEMKIAIFTVDAFTDQPFHGNPAAVCLLEDELEESYHQKIAKEMNLSETAFIRKLHPSDDFSKSSCFGLRWFTPASEVPLCGHATLASAAVLFHIRKNMNSTLTFLTLSGELKARQTGDHITLDLPLYATCPPDFQEVGVLVKIAVGDMNVQDVRYSPDTKKLLVRLSDIYERLDLEKLKVNTQELMLAEKTEKIKGLIVTLKGKSASYDFYSRYFAPWYGVAEDPVTGAAHTILSSYWSQQLGKKEMCGGLTGREAYGALQRNSSICWLLSCQIQLQNKLKCSARGGKLKILLRDDGRLDLGGQTAIVLKGFLII